VIGVAVGDEDRGDRLSGDRGRQRVAMRVVSGPGSMTAMASPRPEPPTMYVPVPWYVNLDGLFAMTRRTSGATWTASP
jgi:hypothetical protein